MAGIIKNDLWTLARGVHGERPLWLRYRSEFIVRPDIREFPKLVRVVWRFEEGPEGVPAAHSPKAMEVFENRLVAALESRLLGVLTASITTGGERTWVLYVRNTQLFSEALHAMPQETDPYPISIQAEDDENWDFLYNNVLPP